MRRFTDINESFVCAHCGKSVPPSSRSCRNHCPFCLHSIHLDVFPGDRNANCGGLLEPVRVISNSKKGYQVVHRCQKCGEERKNVLAFDDPLAPDSFEVVLSLMKKM